MVVHNFGQRSSATLGPPTRQLQVRTTSLNDESRSFEAVVASEQSVPVIDFRLGEIVDEILLATGGEFPESVPLLDSHKRENTVDVIGSMRRFRREGSQWLGVGRVAFGDQHADAVWAKMRDGHLSKFSIGYTVLEYANVRPGESAVVAGRNFTNESDRTLRVVTKWRVHEVSLVAIPADSNAELRSAIPAQRTSSMPLSTPAIHSRESLTGKPTIGTLVSGLMMKNGITDPSQCRAALSPQNSLIRIAPCDQLEREAEQGQVWAANPMIDFIRYAAELDGVRFSEGSGVQGVLMGCWQHYSNRGGVSTANMEALFTQVFGAKFLQGFDSEEDTTAGWTSEADNMNLKAAPRPRMGTLQPLDRRARGAEAKHVEIDAPSEDTKVHEYSGKFTIDEMDIINNMFGNFEQALPVKMGRAAKLLRPDLVYSVLLSNPTMRDGKALFHADHANLLTGALTESTLSDGQALISSQTENGVSLNLRGRYIIVPQKLDRTARKLAREVDLVNDENSPPPVVRSEGRLSNGVTDPASGTSYDGSDTTWFLSADGVNHTIEVSFLRGRNRQPLIRFGFLRMGRFGVWFDVTHAIGATAIDWRGLARSDA